MLVMWDSSEQFLAGEAGASRRLLDVVAWQVLLIVAWWRRVIGAWKVCWFVFPPLPQLNKYYRLFYLFICLFVPILKFCPSV